MMRTATGVGNQSVDRALEVLQALATFKDAKSVREIADTVDLNRTTVYRILESLSAAGLVRRSLGRYLLGPKVLHLADAYLHQLQDLRSVALSGMTRLRDCTGETAALHVRDQMSRVVVDQVESPFEVRRTYPDIGQPLSLHRGAPSVAILAFLTDEELEEYLENAHDLWPNEPIASIPKLKRQLRQVRRVGFALSDQQRTPGVISVAAPIFDRTGAVIGAVNVSGPVQRVTKEHAKGWARLLLETTAEISGALGFASGAVQQHSSSA